MVKAKGSWTLILSALSLVMIRAKTGSESQNRVEDMEIGVGSAWNWGLDKELQSNLEKDFPSLLGK